MADKFQGEATRTLKAAGLWTEKFPDMNFRDKRGQVTDAANAVAREYPLKGRPDSYYMKMSNDCRGGFVEVKTGQGDSHNRFEFRQWREDQIDWYLNYGSRMQHWLMIFLGERVGAQDYPRTVYLIPAGEMLTLIHKIQASNKEKKSISYYEMASFFPNHTLFWLGDKTWKIPAHHPFMEQFK